MKRSLFFRVWRKLVYYVNLCVGKTVDLLTRAGIWGKVPHEVSGHYGDVIEVTHAYPLNYEPQDNTKFDEWKWYKTFPHDLFRVQNALLTTDGIVLQRLRTFIPALPHPVFRYQYGLLYNFRVRLFYRSIPVPAGKRCLLVFDNWSWNNYFHWVIDSMCRLQLLHDHVPGDFTVIIPGNSPKYITECLQLYGYTDIIRIPEKSKVRLTELYTMNYAAWSGQQHPEILSRMVDFVRGKIPATTGNRNRRIYVSRSRAYSRKVSNEEAVLGVLQEHDFEIVYFEGMSFSAQVELMQQAKYFITSHGANMTNLVWMNKGARILELLRKEGRSNFCYWSVASSLGLDYFYQLCSINEADNVVVDISLLRKNIALLLHETHIGT